MKLARYQHGEDFEALEPEMRRRAIAAIARLRDDPFVGVPLKPLQSHQVHRRSLQDCRVIRVPGLSWDGEIRVIYRIVDETVELIAVGPRQGSLCYRMAMDRLKPPAPDIPRWARYAPRRESVSGGKRRVNVAL